MNEPVSVIITCFNLERYIEEAIRSALDQQLDRPFDVIVVDDCSTDWSGELIRAFPAVRYVRTPRNAGVLLAMLDGIGAASGELLFFLDGDDVWEPGKLAACVAAFDDDPACALVTHDLSFIDEDGRRLNRASRPHQMLGPLAEEDRAAATIDAILHHRDYVWLGSALAVRRSLAKVDDFDDWARALPDPANTYQDWPLAFWTAGLAGITAAYIPKRLFRYRLHRSNYSGDASSAPRAARNFTRSRNTLEAMAILAGNRNLPDSVRKTLHARARAYGYLSSLYGGSRIAALKAFPGAITDFFRRGQLTKEGVRLMAVLLVGPERFARTAARR